MSQKKNKDKVQKIKKKYIILIVFFIIIMFIIIYLVNDYNNDQRYLLSQGFEEDDIALSKKFTGYDKYCNESLTSKEGGGFACDFYYMKSPLSPNFSININFGDNTGITYMKKKNILKKEKTRLVIENELSGDEYKAAYCHINEDFTIVEEDEENDPYCYTDEYTTYIKEHKEYIDDALEKFYSYYDNINLARTFVR